MFASDDDVGGLDPRVQQLGGRESELAPPPKTTGTPKNIPNFMVCRCLGRVLHGFPFPVHFACQSMSKFQIERSPLSVKWEQMLHEGEWQNGINGLLFLLWFE